MNKLTILLGFKYSTFLNRQSGQMVYGLANNKDILWYLDVPGEVLYYTQPYINMYHDRKL